MYQLGLRAGELVLSLSASRRRGGRAFHGHGQVPQRQYTGPSEAEGAGGSVADD